MIYKVNLCIQIVWFSFQIEKDHPYCPYQMQHAVAIGTVTHEMLDDLSAPDTVASSMVGGSFTWT